MTRIVVRCALPLLAVLLFVGCTTTTQHNVAAITLCVASIAPDVAVSAASSPPAVGGILGFAGCEVAEALFGQRTAPVAPDPPRWNREAWRGARAGSAPLDKSLRAGGIRSRQERATGPPSKGA